MAQGAIKNLAESSCRENALLRNHSVPRLAVCRAWQWHRELEKASPTLKCKQDLLNEMQEKERLGNELREFQAQVFSGAMGGLIESVFKDLPQRNV